jgi:transcriptional regulator with AAA-type ATPase domain/transcriptional regulatory protein LevR
VRSETVYNALEDLCAKQLQQNGRITGFSTEEIADILNMQRANVAREFSKLIKQEKIGKSTGRPVLYFAKDIDAHPLQNMELNEHIKQKKVVFDSVIGKNSSLKSTIALAKAAIVYPPHGLHTLIIGETGVGKSFFAKTMFKYSQEVRPSAGSGQFTVFNCADYANNPNLLISYLFGVKKGAYTGATVDRQGIIEKARNGILFLDEVHRLTPEGQEMLFTLIDEGKYTPLGDTKEIKINIMIICATTENIESSLLKTFTRRIPIVIKLPSLRERTSEERMELIQRFLEEESKRIGKSVEVEGDALTALLNYDCPNNIGELKSHIQIACAKSFLRSMFSGYVLAIKLEDFPEQVRTGLLVSKKIKPTSIKLNIGSYLYENKEDINDKYSLSGNLYEFIEKRTESLKSKGIDEKTIKNRISNEIEKFINTYLSTINIENKEDGIKRIVNNDLYDLLNSFMYLAEYKLKRKISKNTFLGLLIHIDTFIGRFRENRIIENPKIDEIRKKYPQEFKLAIKLADKLEQKYNLDVPIDEIGFITMFFAADIEEKKPKVGIIVAMHGTNTATSMVDVVNQLLNTNHAIAFDMPLSMNPETALHKIEEMVKISNEGIGVLILVDMGSLKLFDKMIKNSTGIEVRSVDMVTTATAIEATRKAIMNQSLEELVKSIDLESRYVGNLTVDNIKIKKEVIITACSTGQGTAQKIKDIVYTRYDKEKYEVINLSIKDKKEFENAILKIKKEANIVAVISAFNINLPGIEYISMDKFFKDFMGEDFEQGIKKDEFISNIKTVYKDYMELENSDEIVDGFMKIITQLKHIFDIHVDREKLNGLLMHFGSLVQAILNKEETPKCKNVQIITSRYEDIYNYLKDSLDSLGDTLEVTFCSDDVANILEILINI